MTQSEKELDILYHISQAAATRPHTIHELMAEVLDIMETEMGVSRGTLTFLKPDSDIFVIEASRGLTEDEKRLGQYKLGEGITGRVAQTGRSALIPDISKDPRFLNLTQSRADKPTAFICVPIVHQKQIIGTMSIDLNVTTDEDELQRYQRFLELVANILAKRLRAFARRSKSEPASSQKTSGFGGSWVIATVCTILSGTAAPCDRSTSRSYRSPTVRRQF